MEDNVLIYRGADRSRIGDRFDRHRMIAETNAFLDWALGNGEGLPRIPRRRVDQGGFTELMRRPLAKIVAAHWWRRALDRVDF